MGTLPFLVLVNSSSPPLLYHCWHQVTKESKYLHITLYMSMVCTLHQGHLAVIMFCLQVSKGRWAHRTLSPNLSTTHHPAPPAGPAWPGMLGMAGTGGQLCATLTPLRANVWRGWEWPVSTPEILAVPLVRVHSQLLPLVHYQDSSMPCDSPPQVPRQELKGDWSAPPPGRSRPV